MIIVFYCNNIILKVQASIVGIQKLVKCERVFIRILIIFILIVSSKAKLLQQIQELTIVKNDLTSEVRMLCFTVGYNLVR